MKIGTDIIQINRIIKLIDKYGDTFKHKYLCDAEISMIKKMETYAGLWAAKEAISKALGCGICSNLTFHDIIIRKDKRGAPSFVLSDTAQKVHQIVSSSLSISHDGGFAIAVVALTTK
jgi:holo-[acyl-carrier protein] synthase